jgi:hypothetical protein
MQGTFLSFLGPNWSRTRELNPYKIRTKDLSYPVAARLDWYRGADSNCAPPGSQPGMHANYTSRGLKSRRWLHLRFPANRGGWRHFSPADYGHRRMQKACVFRGCWFTAGTVNPYSQTRAVYQLAPSAIGCPGRIRTYSLRIQSPSHSRCASGHQSIWGVLVHLDDRLSPFRVQWTRRQSRTCPHREPSDARVAAPMSAMAERDSNPRFPKIGPPSRT